MHGYLSDKRVFSYQYPFFNRDFEVFSLDLKGFGENDNMDYPFSLDDYVEEVKEFCYKNKVERPSVIAHSFGGRIVTKLSANEKDFFNKIVLTGSAGLKPKKSIKKIFKTTCYKLLKKAKGKKNLDRFFSSDYNKLSEVMKKSFIKI